MENSVILAKHERLAMKSQERKIMGNMDKRLKLKSG
jgi:hypothetical protein